MSRTDVIEWVLELLLWFVIAWFVFTIIAVGRYILEVKWPSGM
jgi:hypothetical protein